MQTGLSDGSKAVVDVCLFMLCTSWMRDDGGDPVKLLERFDVVSHEVGTASGRWPLCGFFYLFWVGCRVFEWVS